MRLLLILTIFIQGIFAYDYFSEAIDAFEKKQLKQALDLFYKSLEQQKEANKKAVILYNLSLTQYDLAQKHPTNQEYLSGAIFSIIEARKLNPLDDDIYFNQQWLLNKYSPESVDKNSLSYFLLDSNYMKIIKWSLYLTNLLLLIYFILFVSQFLFHFSFIKKIVAKLKITIILIAILFLTSLLINLWQNRVLNKPYLVTGYPSPVYSQPDNSKEVATELKTGAVLKYIKSYNDWIQISLANGFIGWIEKKNIYTDKKLSLSE